MLFEILKITLAIYCLDFSGYLIVSILTNTFNSYKISKYIDFSYHMSTPGKHN